LARGADVNDRKRLIAQITEAQHRLKQRLFEVEKHPLLAINLTMSQLKVVLVLQRLGALPGQELARRTGVSLATLTGIVDRLVAQGLVTRGEDPDDRRVRRIELTPAGRDLTDGVLAAGDEHRHRLLEPLSLEDLRVVAHAFELLVSAAERGLGPSGPRDE
jgi:DNA-binding MarR family transcriptional regulator